MPVSGVHFGFAEVAPPSAYAFKCQLPVAVGEPAASLGIGHVEHASFAYPDGHFLRIAGGVF